MAQGDGMCEMVHGPFQCIYLSSSCWKISATMNCGTVVRLYVLLCCGLLVREHVGKEAPSYVCTQILPKERTLERGIRGPGDFTISLE